MDRFINSVKGFAEAHGGTILYALLVLIIGFYLIKLTTKLLSKSLKKSKIEPSVHSFLLSLLNISLKVSLLVSVASILGIPPTTFIAVLSAAGLAIGLALKDSLSNFASGLLILVFKQFKVGDYVETGAYMGTVKEIHLLYTVLNTFDNKRVIVPNQQITNAVLVNYTAEETRRVDITFGIGYDDDFRLAQGIILDIVNQHDLILEDPAPLVRMTGHGDSAILIISKVHVKKEDYWTVLYDLHEMVKEGFDQNNITIPYPQRDVHLKQV